MLRRNQSILYHRNEPNHCPSCAKSNWIVGRLLAECAFCGTALPIYGAESPGPVFMNRRYGVVELRA